MATKSMFDTKDRLSQQTDYTSVLIEANRDELVLIDYLTRTGIKGIAAGKDWTRETEAKSAQKVGIKRIAEGNDWDRARSWTMGACRPSAPRTRSRTTRSS